MFEEITINYLFHLMLVFARLGTAFSKFPAIGSNYIFMRGKLAFSMLVSIMIMPIIEYHLPSYSKSFALNIGYLTIEIFIGIIVSLAANIYFQTLYLVGQVISMQSGLGSAAFYDPTQREQVTLFSNFLVLIAVIFIFSSNTHYIFIQAIIDSYNKFPPGELLDSGEVSEFVSFVINDSFILSFKLVSPFIIVSLAILTGSSMLARLMPNLQVFFVLTPVQILVMFGVLYIVVNEIINKLVKVIIYSLNISGI